MLKLGEKQILQMVKKVDFGVYLTDPSDHNDTRVLLPRKQVPKGLKTGDEIEVFLYRDSDDRLIATVNEPKVTLGKIAVLEVAAVGRMGAFLDWGLEKDLFLPYKEQTGKIRKGDQILAALYIDKSERLCATMKVYHYLERTQQYHRDDIVTARVYEVSERFGAYLAVDDKYKAMISPKQDIRSLRPGQVLECRVERVKPDGKLDLTQRDKAYKQMDKDAARIMELLDIYDGELPLNEKSDPQLIMEETGLSKNAFKRALGRLYKEQKITLGEKIRRK